MTEDQPMTALHPEPLIPLPIPKVTGPWSNSNATYLAGRAALDPVDHLASEMETYWGCGRLRLLVSNDLRERFDRQRLKLNHAIWHGDLPTLQHEAARMLTAYKHLNETAQDNAELGVSMLGFPCLECTLQDGSIAVIVPSNIEAHQIIHQDRRCHVYTIEEIARLIDGYPTLAKIKHSFPGATVTNIRRSVPDPLDGTLPIKDDEPPWL
jgi:hypothetical protein